MSVVSVIVMSYQFGTNWVMFSNKAGPVIGPPMGYGVLTAFLKAGFIGVMLFGRERVGPGLHFFRHKHGRLRHADFRDLGSCRKSLDADVGGFGMNDKGQFIPIIGRQ